MSIWKNPIDIAFINQINGTCLPGHLGIELIEVGDDFIKATMPVDHRTKQPMGLLHGGASAALSETMGSIASLLAAGDFGKYSIVGIEINANHLKSAKDGYVTATTKPIKIGRTIHVWDTEIHDLKGELLCVSRLTVMVREVEN
jgi:1,4-dihydroxy-2-naphthoyl-CoA hydrolase